MNPAHSTIQLSCSRMGGVNPSRPKRPILYCAISFSAGISLAYFFNIPIVNFAAGSLLLIILASVFFKNSVISHIFLYLALVFFGAAYYQNYNILPENHIANFISDTGRMVSIRGVVADDPVKKKAFFGKEKINFTLKASLITDEGGIHDVTGLVRVDIYTDEEGGVYPAHPPVTQLDSRIGGVHPAYSTAAQLNSRMGGVHPAYPTAAQLNSRMGGVNFGDEIVMQGILSRPQGLKNPGIFDYSNYLKIKNIYAVLTVNGIAAVRVIKSGQASRIQLWAYSFRHRIDDAITRYVDPSTSSGSIPIFGRGIDPSIYSGSTQGPGREVDSRYSGFLKAVLAGERSGLDSSITDDFIKTGTAHVIAISGLHIAFIAGIFIFIFRIFRIRKKAILVLTSGVLIFYCFVAGANPPVVRATIMFVIASLGYLIDRESDILNSLAMAVFIILLLNPKELFDPSLQLSFASISGIILFSPVIEGLFLPKTNYFIKSMAVSIAAIIAVLPIIAKYFNIFSPIAIIANLVIVPALFVIMTASLIFIFLNFFSFNFISVYAGKALLLLIQAMFWINHVLAQTPLSHIRIPSLSFPVICLYYIFVFCFFFFKRKKEAFIVLLLIMNISVWGNIFSAKDKALKITFLDVGKGDSILLEFPDGGTMLIDTGEGGIEGFADMGRSVVAPYLWNKGIRRLDAVVSTHFHRDHMGGVLYILKNFDIGCVIDGGLSSGSSEHLYDSYRKIILQKNLRRLNVADGNEIMGFGDVKLFVINPPEDRADLDTNDSSVVIKLEYENFSALFCGDISGKAIEGMLRYKDFLKSDILKVPHHGGSTGKEGLARIFFEEVSPEVSIVSSSANFHSKNLPESGYYFTSVAYNTKSSGAIEVSTDGMCAGKFAVKPFCKNN